MALTNRIVYFAMAGLCLAGACSSGKIADGVDAGFGAAGVGGPGLAGTTGTAGAGGGAAGSTGGSGAGTTGSGGGQAGSGQAGTGVDAGVVGNCTPPDDLYAPIEQLSRTGCVDPNDPTKPSPRAVSYEVNSALWSDGADKTRAFILPQGQKIHVDATTGKWAFPVGSVLIKNFLFDGKFVETRLFMHADADTWIGYGYKWNGQGAAKQTEATVVGIGRDDVVFDTGKRPVHWYYPSRQDCMDCHNKVAGGVLGPQTAQMYRVATGHTKNQMDEFQTMGLFDAAPTAPTADKVLVPATSTTATLEQKARSYLAANCSHCHQPNDGNVMSPFPNFDLRFGTSLKDAKICNATAAKGVVPGSDATIILFPGQPSKSLISVRMNQPYTSDNTSGRMPQIGTHEIDMTGAKVVSDWITSITACP
jgi:uncharacterized repeat protein (TIGR03806 family)